MYAAAFSSSPRIDGREKTWFVHLMYVLAFFHVLTVLHYLHVVKQALVTATLGTQRDAQIIDSLLGEKKDNFLLHYNFPPYCVGETGFVGSPKRREIGHGKLAKRGIAAVMPSVEESHAQYVLCLKSLNQTVRLQWHIL